MTRLVLIYSSLALIIGLKAIASSLPQGADIYMTPYEQAISPPTEDYIPWQVYPGCLIKSALKETIKLCVLGNGNLRRAKDYSGQALKLWLEAIRPLNEQVATRVEFSCDNPNGYVNVYAGSGREFASPGTIHVFDGSYFGSYLHEFGHAFACLGDTYMGSAAGHCIAGQPHSIMCDGLLRNDLSEDDIHGVHRQYHSSFGRH